MGGHGPIPKDPATTVRRARKRTVEVSGKPAAASDATPAPRPLPTYPRAGGRWHADTVAWWKMLQSLPQSSTWLESDWAELGRLARLHDLWRRATDVKDVLALEKELRVSGNRFGLTAADRARIGIKVADPKREAEKQEAAGNVTQIDSRAATRKALFGG